MGLTLGQSILPPSTNISFSIANCHGDSWQVSHHTHQLSLVCVLLEPTLDFKSAMKGLRLSCLWFSNLLLLKFSFFPKLMTVMPNAIILHAGNAEPIWSKEFYLEVSGLTDVQRHSSNRYKTEEGGSPSRSIIYFRFRNTASHFHNRYMWPSRMIQAFGTGFEKSIHRVHPYTSIKKSQCQEDSGKYSGSN